MSLVTPFLLEHGVDNTQNRKITKPVTNKLVIVKKTHKHTSTKETKSKPTGPSSPVRTADMSLSTISSYPPDNHHISDNWRGDYESYAQYSLRLLLATVLHIARCC